MKILLTGGTGFLGKNLTKILRETYGPMEIRSVGSTCWDLRESKYSDEVIDRFKPEVVIHAAGSVGGIGANQENPGKFMYDNLIMGTNIIHSAMKAKVPKFILLGTVCAYPKFTPVPFKEADLWNGYPEETNAPYGIAKKTLMRLVEAYHEQYDFNGINLIPVNMYGPHDHFNLTSSHVIPALIVKVRQAIKKESPSITLWGTGEASREFLFAGDCGQAIINAINTDGLSPEPINIGTGKEIKIKDLVKEIADIMGYKGDIIYDSSKPDGQPRRCLDTSRAKERLGFEAQVELKEGLQQTINWYMENRNA
tara:strand:+ start:1237 stop:2166 length:930 start_codon:yes stop_codon:yes gene_type:complete